jgi:hypothetical protein
MPVIRISEKMQQALLDLDVVDNFERRRLVNSRQLERYLTTVDLHPLKPHPKLYPISLKPYPSTHTQISQLPSHLIVTKWTVTTTEKAQVSIFFPRYIELNSP